MSELLPCPFCGSDGDSVSILEDHGAFEPGCGHCGISIGMYSSERSARTHWNRRAPQQNEPVREALMELVACKDLKDKAQAIFDNRWQDGKQVGEDEYMRLNAEYMQRQPLAWAAARKALALPLDAIQTEGKK